MGRVTFRENRCKGCELCKAFCPKGIITMANRINSMGFHPATVEEENMDKCTGCAICARMCPDLVIEVEKEGKKVG